MQKSVLIRALQQEIRRHDFNYFVQATSIAQGGKGVVVRVSGLHEVTVRRGVYQDDGDANPQDYWCGVNRVPRRGFTFARIVHRAIALDGFSSLLVGIASKH